MPRNTRGELTSLRQEVSIMDFTGMLMQDQYKAIVDERSRAIDSARWRRAWFARKIVESDDCCGDGTVVCASTIVRANVTAGHA